MIDLRIATEPLWHQGFESYLSLKDLVHLFSDSSYEIIRVEYAKGFGEVVFRIVCSDESYDTFYTTEEEWDTAWREVHGIVKVDWATEGF